MAGRSMAGLGDLPLFVRVILIVLYLLAIFQWLHAADAQPTVTQENPDFVFVHGIGHGAWCFSEVIAFLQDVGLSATAVDLTSQGVNKAFAENVKSVEDYLQPLSDLFASSILKPTILVGHSLGGGPISVIMEKYPSKIAKAVYLAASMPVNNQTFFDAFPPSVFTRLLADGNLILNNDPPTSFSLDRDTLAAYFYNKSPEEAVVLAQTLVVPTPYVPGNEPITLTPGNYGRVRRFYIKTSEDLGVLPFAQAQIIAANPPEKTFKLYGADHAAFFSQPRALRDILVRIAKTT